jgi:lysophospholipase L1-like esterase
MLGDNNSGIVRFVQHALRVPGVKSSTFTERGEAIRKAANEWIRTSGAFDAVVDFDAATRDRTNSQRFRAEAESPDLLHPGDGGYRLMADAFDLAVFTRPAGDTTGK